MMYFWENFKIKNDESQDQQVFFWKNRATEVRNEQVVNLG